MTDPFKQNYQEACGNDGTITELSRSTYFWKIKNLYMTNCYFKSRRFFVWRHKYEFSIEISPRKIGYGYLRLYLHRGNILKHLPMLLELTYANKHKQCIVKTGKLYTFSNNVFYSLGNYKTKGLNAIKFQYLMEVSEKAVVVGYKSDDKVQIIKQCVVCVDSNRGQINTDAGQLISSTGKKSTDRIQMSRKPQLNNDEKKIESVKLLTSKGLNTLSEDLKDAFLNKEDSDIMFKVGSEWYPAHKVVLKSRSSVFKTMLKYNMLEKEQGFIDITDCDPCIFHNFLKYLYTGKLDGISNENISKLYHMSDKYDVKVLKKHCAELLASNFNTENICDVISLATAQNESDLLASATEFFIHNAKSIVTTLAWQTLLKDNPTLANELFIKTLNTDTGMIQIIDLSS